MPEQQRTFASLDSFYDWALQSVGASVAGYDENEERAGLMFEWRMEGKAFFYDGTTGAFFNVANPVLAYMGGTSGTIKIGNDEVCIDPDGSCGTGLPSYFELEAGHTADTVTLGGGGEFVRYHSNLESGVWSVFFSFVSGGGESRVIRSTARIRFCTGESPQPGETQALNFLNTGTDVCVLRTVNGASVLTTRSRMDEATPTGYTGAFNTIAGSTAGTDSINIGFLVLSGQAWFTETGSVERIRLGSNRVCSTGTHTNVGSLANASASSDDAILGGVLPCPIYP